MKNLSPTHLLPLVQEGDNESSESALCITLDKQAVLEMVETISQSDILGCYPLHPDDLYPIFIRWIHSRINEILEEPGLEIIKSPIRFEKEVTLKLLQLEEYDNRLLG
jgi:hypothetical protein